MEYKYYNQFSLSNELSQSISSIISKKEKSDYICKIITVTIPEHKGLVFHSPLTDEDIYKQGASSLNGAQIQSINEKYGRYSDRIIPAESYSFLVVMTNEQFKSFSKLSFHDESSIKEALQSHSVIYESYFGSFDSRTLIQKFPYLQEFFSYLDKWRSETKRVTIDDDILEKGIKRSLIITKK